MQMLVAPERSSIAGPAFGLSRHVTLPVDERAASVLVSERLAELRAIASRLAAALVAPPALGRVEAILRRLPSLSGF